MCNCNKSIITTSSKYCGCDTPQQNCDCPVRISTDCVTFSGDDLPCSGIVAGQDLTATLKQLDAYICTALSQITSNFSLINIGSGFGIYDGIDSVGKHKLKSITKTGNLINILNNTNDINFSVNETELISFIQSNSQSVDTTALHKTGNEVFTGIKSATNTGDTITNGISLTNNGVFGSFSLLAEATSTGTGMMASSSGTTSSGIYSVNTSSAGNGIYSLTQSGTGIYLEANGTGSNVVSNILGGSGLAYVGQDNGTNTFTVNKGGNVKGTSFIKTGGLSSQYLMADGSVTTGVTDASALHQTGDESWSGIKSSTNTGSSSINGLNLINNGTGIASVLNITNSSSGRGISITNSSLGGSGTFTANQSTGYGSVFINSGAGQGIYLQNESFGDGIVASGSAASTGFLYVGKSGTGNTFTVNKTGNVTGASFIKTGGLSSQYLMADGSVSTGGSVDTTALHKTGDESFTGIKSSTISGNTPAIQLTNNGAYNTFIIDNNNSGRGSYITNNNVGGVGQFIEDTVGGTCQSLKNKLNGVGQDITNEQGGVGLRFYNLLGATAKPISYLKNNIEKAYLNDAGYWAGTGFRTLTGTGLNVFKDDGTVVATNTLQRLSSYTVSTLPAGVQGDQAMVTDASSPTYNTTVVGGGSVKVRVYYDGTSWKS